MVVRAVPERLEGRRELGDMRMDDGCRRAANHLSVGRLYLLDNRLPREPSAPEQEHLQKMQDERRRARADRRSDVEDDEAIPGWTWPY
jgi:hypothetical protein